MGPGRLAGNCAWAWRLQNASRKKPPAQSNVYANSNLLSLVLNKKVGAGRACRRASWSVVPQKMFCPAHKASIDRYRQRLFT
jgi:hypothetical protein